MKTYFVDTNVFLRFLLADQQEQYELAKKLFQLAEKEKVFLWTTDIVILEIIWTLSSFYELKPTAIKEKISSLLALKSLRVKNKTLLLRALEEYTEKAVDFADAYNFFLAKKEKKRVISFDKDFDRLGERENLEKLVYENDRHSS